MKTPAACVAAGVFCLAFTGDQHVGIRPFEIYGDGIGGELGAVGEHDGFATRAPNGAIWRWSPPTT